MFQGLVIRYSVYSTIIDLPAKHSDVVLETYASSQDSSMLSFGLVSVLLAKWESRSWSRFG